MSTTGPGARIRAGLRRWRRAWRRAVRPLWREARPTLMLLVAIAALVLGTVGFMDLPGKHFSFADALYRAIQLFGLGSGALDQPVPTTLQIARIIAPLVTGVAAVSAVLALWRSQLQVLGIRLLMRGHVVVAGTGRTGSRLATAFHEAGHKVVGIELDPANPHLPSLAARGIGVLIGDATDPALLRRARVGGARRLFVTCGEDGRNVDVAMVAAHRTAGRFGVLTAFVHLVDLALWRTLRAEAVVAIDAPEFRLELFNVLDAGARILLDEHPPFADREGRPLEDPHVCVVGLDGVGEHVVVQMARRSRTERAGKRRLRLTVAGPDADAARAALVERHPELEDICELDARPGPVDSAWFQRGGALLDAEGRCDVTRAYVSFARESESLTAALGLHGAPATRDIPVVVAVDDSEGGLAQVLGSEGSAFARNVEPFGVLSSALVPALMLGGTIETLARAKHEDYRRNERERAAAEGRPPPTGPQMEPWERLPESLRESNRRFADGVGAKLAAAGCAVVPAPLIDPLGDLFGFTDAEIEDLARQEHDRWMHDLLRDGWRRTAGEKDPERKLHPLLVRWEELSEAYREKDRDAARLIPRMLAQAGYELYRPRA
jgi:voltage-gated potassium channel Kch/preprotein translocase subunit Sss1